MRKEKKNKNLPWDQLLKQVKTGMFKLGQQNFSIEQKIDSLVEILNKDGSAPQRNPKFQWIRWVLQTLVKPALNLVV